MRDLNEADFLAGRDLAVQLLQAAQAAGDDACMIDLWRTEADGYGRGRRAILPFLEVLREQPQLTEGFAAILADWISDGAPHDASFYSELTYAAMTGDGPRLADIEPPRGNVFAFERKFHHGD